MDDVVRKVRHLVGDPGKLLAPDALDGRVLEHVLEVHQQALVLAQVQHAPLEGLQGRADGIHRQGALLAVLPVKGLVVGATTQSHVGAPGDVVVALGDDDLGGDPGDPGVDDVVDGAGIPHAPGDTLAHDAPPEGPLHVEAPTRGDHRDHAVGTDNGQDRGCVPVPHPPPGDGAIKLVLLHLSLQPLTTPDGGRLVKSCQPVPFLFLVSLSLQPLTTPTQGCLAKSVGTMVANGPL